MSDNYYELQRYFQQYLLTRLIFGSVYLFLDMKEDADSKGKSKAKKKEPASMFQINGDKPETKSKKKGSVLRAFLHACPLDHYNNVYVRLSFG